MSGSHSCLPGRPLRPTTPSGIATASMPAGRSIRIRLKASTIVFVGRSPASSTISARNSRTSSSTKSDFAGLSVSLPARSHAGHEKDERSSSPARRGSPQLCSYPPCSDRQSVGSSAAPSVVVSTSAAPSLSLVDKGVARFPVRTGNALTQWCSPTTAAYACQDVPDGVRSLQRCRRWLQSLDGTPGYRSRM